MSRSSSCRRDVASRTGRTLLAVAAAAVLAATAAVASPAAADPADDDPATAAAADCGADTTGSQLYLACTPSAEASSIDLSAVPDEWAVDSDTVIWIQAYGGAGADTEIGEAWSFGGAPGFAQMITTLGDYEATYGSTMLYYALGESGAPTVTSDRTAAGQGGASTIVAGVDPARTKLDIDRNVVLIAGGGGGSALSCTAGQCASSGTVQLAWGGNGGTAVSNEGGRIEAGTAGRGPAPGGGGSGGAGGSISPSDGDGMGGWSGTGGAGGGVGSGVVAEWPNALDVPEAIEPAGQGGDSPCTTSGGQQVCVAGAGGGGWGGGATGSNVSGQVQASGGGGGGSFAAPSTATDPNAPTGYPTIPPGPGTVSVVYQVELDLATTFCKEATLAGTEGFRCVVPFNWNFEIPAAYTGDEWLVTLQAVGGRGGNGDWGGRAQTTRLTTGLAGKTLYAWVGEQGSESAGAGGGGGGVTALGLAGDPWQGGTSNTLSPDLLLVAGGGGGGTALNACSDMDGDGGGAGGVAIAAGSSPATGDGNHGGGDGGVGGFFSGGVWDAGWDGSGSGGDGTSGSGGLTFIAGVGGPHTTSGGTPAATVESWAGGTPTSSIMGGAGNGGTGSCQGGGGGAGAATGGGGAGGSGDVGDGNLSQGGGGGGGGSFAAASDVEASLLPAWAGDWLTLSDQTSGQVSLFFYKASQGPPPVPADGATIDHVQPTLGLDGSHSGDFAYRVTDQTAGTTYLASPSTSNELWTIPADGALVPGHTYSWEIVAGGNAVQPARTFTVSDTAQAGSAGVRVEMRSMNHYADSSSPAYIQPESGQKVPGISSKLSTPQACEVGDEPNCHDYTGTAAAPDDYSEYFTTSTAAQATTNPGAINMDFAAFDPFGLGLSELFTLDITGTLTVPVTDDYTLGVWAFGGARLVLRDPAGHTVGGDPLFDSWGQVANCSVTFRAEAQNLDSWIAEAEDLAPLGCVNDHGPTMASDTVSLTAGTAYTFEMQGFMSWQPGPFQLLYTSDLFASDPAPVPGAWLTQPATTLEEEPEPTCGGLAATIVGTDDADLLIGTPDDDVIWGGDGNDRIHGGGGNDTICGGDGNDVLRGQAHNDTIWGGAGADAIHGGSGDDHANGDDGNDTIHGGSGSDTLTGGNGNDTLNGITHQRWLHRPTGYRNADHADGGHGADTCRLVPPVRATSCEL